MRVSLCQLPHRRRDAGSDGLHHVSLGLDPDRLLRVNRLVRLSLSEWKRKELIS